MTGKMTKFEKVIEIIAACILVDSIILKCLIGYNDVGTLVILAFMGVMVWFIFLICAFFPADWRMTENQKKKISDMVQYQNNYRKVLIGIDAIIAIVFSILIITVS